MPQTFLERSVAKAEQSIFNERPKCFCEFKHSEIGVPLSPIIAHTIPGLVSLELNSSMALIGSPENNVTSASDEVFAVSTSAHLLLYQ